MSSHPFHSTSKNYPSAYYAPVHAGPFGANEPAIDAKRPTKASKNGHPKNLRREYPREVFSSLRWWLPEILASILSVGILISLVGLLRHYHGRHLEDLNLPSSLTLNGLVAILPTLNRVVLMVPIASATSQEAWLWFSKAPKGPNQRSELRDLERSDSASRGALGSVLFLLRAKRRSTLLIVM